MCEGRCQVQFYDVDFSGVTITADPANQRWCPATTPVQEIADLVQPFFVKIGCDEADCVCDLYPDQTPNWTDWREYNAPGEAIIFIGGGADKPCKYTLAGTYKVATSIEDGLCIKEPKGWKGYPRPKKPSAKKKAAEKSDHTPKKKAVHKTGFRVFGRRGQTQRRRRG